MSKLNYINPTDHCFVMLIIMGLTQESRPPLATLFYIIDLRHISSIINQQPMNVYPKHFALLFYDLNCVFQVQSHRNTVF